MRDSFIFAQIMTDTDLFFEWKPVKDKKEILELIAGDIKRFGLEQKLFDFFVGLITEDINIFSKFEPKLLTLSSKIIAHQLLD